MTETTMPMFAQPLAAAAVLGVSRTTLYRLMAAGTLRGRKVGRATLIDLREAAEVIRSLPAAHVTLPQDTARRHRKAAPPKPPPLAA